MLEKLRDAIAGLAELAQEKSELDSRAAKAQAEIAACSLQKVTNETEQKILRASNVIAVCRGRLAALEAGAGERCPSLRDIYDESRCAWNETCAVRREILRANFLAANLRFFDNREDIVAERLAGILPLPMIRMARAGWNGFWPPSEGPFALLKEVDSFINHVQEKSAACGIPIK